MFVRSAAFRRTIIIALQFGATAAAVAFIVRRVDLGSTRDSFAQANLAWIPVAALFLLLDLALRAVRWRLLLSPRDGLRFSNLFGASNVGYLVNDILPLRAGEVARVLVIDEVERTGKVRAGSSVVIERAIDLVAMALLVLLLLPFIDAPAWARGPALALGACVLAGLVLVAIVARLNEAGWRGWRAWLERVPKAGRRLSELADEVLLGAHPLMRMGVLAPVVALTALIWVCAALSFFFVMRAFAIDGGFAAAAFVLAATTLGMVVPSSPGYVGVFHAIAVSTLANVFGVGRADALSYAVAQHALIVVMPSALGVGYLVTRRDVLPGLFDSVWGRAWRGSPTEAGRAAAEPVAAEPALSTVDA